MQNEKFRDLIISMQNVINDNEKIRQNLFQMSSLIHNINISNNNEIFKDLLNNTSMILDACKNNIDKIKESTQIDKYIIYVDGAFRGKESSSGFIVKDIEGNELYSCVELLGHKTNNEAEYHALEMAVDWCIENDLKCTVKLLSDSLIVVNQINGLFKVRSENLKKFHTNILSKLNSSNMNYEVCHITREKNFKADSLVSKVLNSNDE